MFGARAFRPLRSRRVPKALGGRPEENRGRRVAPRQLFPLVLVAAAPGGLRVLVGNGWENGSVTWCCGK